VITNVGMKGMHCTQRSWLAASEIILPGADRL